MTRRVVITGMGTVNALSTDLAGYWRALCAGQSGVGRLEQFDTSAFKVHIAGEVKNFKPDGQIGAKTARRLDRFAQFALMAALSAFKDSGLEMDREDPFRCGVILGCGIGGLNEFEDQHGRYIQEGPARVNPFTIPKMIINAAPSTVSIELGLRGPNTAVATACASAANAVSDAFDAIRWDKAEVMLTGGTEAALTPMGLGGFIAARALSLRNEEPTRASRPFDKDRDGFVMAEGAGILVLEELEHAQQRGASIYAEVLGAASTSDAHHITAPLPCGSGAAKAMELALRCARINPPEVQYINAHGTSTDLGDVAETRSPQAGVRRPRAPPGHQQHQKHARPSPGRQWGSRVDCHRPDYSPQRGSPDDQLRDSRSRV